MIVSLHQPKPQPAAWLPHQLLLLMRSPIVACFIVQGRLSGDVQNLQALLKSVFPLVYGRLFAWGQARRL